jgi:hypothetical protein
MLDNIANLIVSSIKVLMNILDIHLPEPHIICLVLCVYFSCTHAGDRSDEHVRCRRVSYHSRSRSHGLRSDYINKRG